jgi:hypothetical protein
MAKAIEANKKSCLLVRGNLGEANEVFAVGFDFIADSIKIMQKKLTNKKKKD